jgi:hypothetical protein
VSHVDRQFFSVAGGQKEAAMAADEKVMVGVPGFDLEGENMNGIQYSRIRFPMGVRVLTSVINSLSVTLIILPLQNTSER